MDTERFRFIGGCVVGAGDGPLLVAAEDLHLAAAGKPQSVFSLYLDGQWHPLETRLDWTTFSMTAARTPGESTWSVLALGEGGPVCELRPSAEGSTASVSSIPGHIGMTHLATIDNVIYACGLGREVLRREVDGRWTDLSAPAPGVDDGVVHFTGLAGRSANEIYAVGWKGEIWVRTGEGWSREDSPTRAQLGAVTLTEEGLVYIVGQEGTLVRGRRGRWEALDTGLHEDLRDVCVHAGEVFVSTDSRVFKLTGEGVLSALADDSDEQVEDTSCRMLLSAANLGLCSIKSGGVFLLKDDGTWDRLG
ncbi:hypothetical protein [Pyxidicoccus sp. MSG2]|uniref:hypothetical protein n=1 Tax=Pyxidicoccus sp. MSG2 TaxID=2996790 RepID=UPI00226E42ED|nr:hypothetical protein [Pyxidicoccus sp. MSG2]MCY1018742.1 hypothetical protein [Pyxidicoccus sp. MSG2]